MVCTTARLLVSHKISTSPETETDRKWRGEAKVWVRAVPKEMSEALRRTVASLENLEAELPNILSLSNPFILSKGTNPDYHPLKSELDRLKVYQRKLEPFGDVGQELILVDLGFCLRSSTTAFFFLDDQASVDHSLRDLTSVQRKEMANMSIGEVPMMSNYQEQAGQKRKHPSSEEHPVQVCSEVHVKKEPLEVFGHNNGKTEEPIVIDISDDDE
ncbi:hypothetical protein Ahy_B03g063891 isoform B [Arachis hypogaea]|uniref:Uncharacterized protein n=1 Tax=Arachis hypogaea TaxID=3818 RepID=A0A444ZY76_ARAHY|nr:hypothetical protein Ahy_B03g063891 isoform A [Arachis hypogaea]RYR19181.1 hypothetical protein Ahy_B03g063891 isoform B [Arachis hypogaea]